MPDSIDYTKYVKNFYSQAQTQKRGKSQNCSGISELRKSKVMYTLHDESMIQEREETQTHH